MCKEAVGIIPARKFQIPTFGVRGWSWFGPEMLSDKLLGLRSEILTG